MSSTLSMDDEKKSQRLVDEGMSLSIAVSHLCREEDAREFL